MTAANQFSATASGLAQPTRPLAEVKIMKLKAVQIRVLLGKGGETIKSICDSTASDIRVDHDRVSEEGEISIIGDIARAEKCVRETLAAKGAPVEDEIGPPLPGEEDLVVPSDMVGLFIGKGGEHIKKIRDALGGSLFIGVDAPPEGNGPHKIQIVGDRREEAKELVRGRLKEMYEEQAARKKSNQGRPKHMEGPMGGNWQNLPQAARGGPVLPAGRVSPGQPARPQGRKPQGQAWGGGGSKGNSVFRGQQNWGLGCGDSWGDSWGDAWGGSWGGDWGESLPSMGLPALNRAPAWNKGMAWGAGDGGGCWNDPAGLGAGGAAANLAIGGGGMPSSQRAEMIMDAAPQEDNPWAGIVPECDLP